MWVTLLYITISVEAMQATDPLILGSDDDDREVDVDSRKLQKTYIMVFCKMIALNFRKL